MDIETIKMAGMVLFWIVIGTTIAWSLVAVGTDGDGEA